MYLCRRNIGLQSSNVATKELSGLIDLKSIIGSDFIKTKSPIYHFFFFFHFKEATKSLIGIYIKVGKK